MSRLSKGQKRLQQAMVAVGQEYRLDQLHCVTTMPEYEGGIAHVALVQALERFIGAGQ